MSTFLSEHETSSSSLKEKLTKIIAAGNYQALKSFVDKYPEDIDNFVEGNVSFLRLALQKQNFGVFSLLCSEGFPLTTASETSNDSNKSVTMDSECHCRPADDFNSNNQFKKEVFKAHFEISVELRVIRNAFRTSKIVDASLLYKKTADDELWLDCVEKLTFMIDDVIEFAKRLALFMALQIEDQILLIKHSVFEIVIIRTSRFIDLTQNAVLFGDVMISQEALKASEDPGMKLLCGIFGTAKKIAELKLTETDLALFQCFVLMWPDKFQEPNHLRDNTGSSRMFNKCVAALEQEFVQMKGKIIKIMTTFVELMPQLRTLADLHVDVYRNFKQKNPKTNFPPLYDEIFKTSDKN